MHIFPTVRRHASKITMDWRGRATEREVKLQILADTSNPSQGFAWSKSGTLGRVARFGDILADTRNPSQGLARSNAKTRGKVAHFGDILADTRNPSQGLAWSNAKTRSKVAHFGDILGDTSGRTQEREVKLHIFSNFSVSRATLTRVWRGQATEREVKLHIFGATRNPSQCGRTFTL